MKSKILIIQPHSDDALFSVSHLIFSKNNISILTVENDKRRIEEDRKLYEFLGKDWNHLNVDFFDQSFYSFHKKYKTLNSKNAIEHLIEFFGQDKLDEICESVLDFINCFIDKSKNGVILYVPWGIGHPFHFFIRDIISKNFDKKMIRYYREFPHSYKKRSREQIEEELNNFKLLETHDILEWADIKWNLAKKFYKSQSGLFWYEQGYIKKNLPEEIYIKK